MDVTDLLKDPAIREQYTRLEPQAAAAWAWRMMWLTKALKHQILPHGDWWSIWLMLASPNLLLAMALAFCSGIFLDSAHLTKACLALPAGSLSQFTCHPIGA